MSRCASGASKSFSCAKSSQVARIKVTASRWHASPVYQKKSSTGPKTSLPISKTPTAQQNQGREERNQRTQCRNPKSRSWICCKKSPRSSRNGEDRFCADALSLALLQPRQPDWSAVRDDVAPAGV